MACRRVVPLELSAEEIKHIYSAADFILSGLEPYLLKQEEEEKSKPKIPFVSYANYPFVRKTIQYVEKHPEFSPLYLDAPGLINLYNSIDLLAEIYEKLNGIQSRILGTLQVSGTEAFHSALEYYSTVKLGIQAKIPNAKEVYDDLKKTRFEKCGPRKRNQTEFDLD